MKRLLAFIAAFILAATAQRTLSKGGVPGDAAILFALAAAIFAGFAEKPATWPRLPPRKRWRPISMVLTGAAVLIGLAALVLFWVRRGMATQFAGAAFWLWLLCVPLYLIAVWLSEGEAACPWRAGQRRLTGAILRLAARISAHRWELLLLLVILVSALVVRVRSLDAIPNGCQSDECNNGLDALKWLGGAPYVPYAETNEGQATLFTYLLALAFRLLGASVPTMRLVSALIGTLTVLAFYFLARDLFGWKAALVAAGLLAASRWHLTFSRIVYELIMVPLFEILLFMFLLRGLRRGRRSDWALAGAALSVGLNTYTGFRVVPFLVVGFLAYWLVFVLVTDRRKGVAPPGELGASPAGERLSASGPVGASVEAQPPRWVLPGRLQSSLEGVACFAGAAALTVLPLGVYTVQHWNVFVSRTEHISVFRDVERAGSYAPLWENLRKTLFMFNWRGDHAALNNLPGAPLLDFLVAVLFVLGLAYALRHINRPLSFLCVTWFGGVASLAVLSVAHEAPTARRPIGLVPLIYLLVALVVDQTWRAVHQAGWRGKRVDRALAAVFAAAVLGVGISNMRTYFVDQALDPNVLFAYSPSESAVGRYLAELENDAYILMTPGYAHHSAVRFIGQRPVTPLNLGAHVPLREDLDRDLLYILEPVDERLGPLFQQVYPGGTWTVHRDSVGRGLFVSFEVPQATLSAARGVAGRYFAGGDMSGAPDVAQRDGVLEFDWRVVQPLDPPFSAVWEGALLVSQYGQHHFELTVGGGRAAFQLDGDPLLLVEDGIAVIDRTLAGGFYGLRLEFVSDASPESLRLTWSGPGFEQRAVGAGSLYSLPGATNGLVGYYYPNPAWSGTPALIQRDLFILPNNPLMEPFSILWSGQIAAPREGVYRFGTRSDDGSFVYVDGQVVVDNGGEHGSEFHEGSIQLSEGFHDIEVRYFQSGGSREMQLWWAPPGGGQEIIPSQYLFPLEEIPEGLELPELVLAPVPTPTFEQIPVDEEVTPELGAETAPPLPAGGLGSLPVLQVELLWQAGRCGSGSGEFQMPSGVAADAGGALYVADAGNRRVVKLSPAGEWLLTWGAEGEGSGEFIEPFDLVVEADGSVVVLDAVAHQLQRFTPDGRFVGLFGLDMAFYRPRGLGADTQGNLYVADTGGVRLLKLSSSGERLMQIGGPEEAIGPGQPTDVAVHGGGDIYVVEAMTGVAWWLDAGGTLLGRWQIAQANTLDSPHVATDQQDRVYITDPEGARVLVFARSGDPLGQFGTLGDGSGQFRKPVGIAVGPQGQVAVTDSHACKVAVFGAIP
jgi:DNA-binding beta-propeller fold protein YncE